MSPPPPKKYHCSRISQCYFIWEMSLQMMIKNLEMRTYVSWTICVDSKCHSKCPYKKEAEDKEEKAM